MRIEELQSREAVLEAIKEFDNLGRANFLNKHHFGQARSYYLVRDGRLYDSKAIAGVAYKNEFGVSVNSEDFSGGEKTVRKTLERLEFDVIDIQSSSELISSSAFLKEGKVYTREDLKQLFRISDATINTGIFQPKGHRSIWLFVTEQKTNDREQYLDKLEGDTLFWQGQKQGRKDHLVIDHKNNNQEILLFYRKKKYEYDKAGFKFVGVFEHVRHSGEKPTSFELKRHINFFRLSDCYDSLEGEEPFNPSGIEDSRKKTFRAIAIRAGQQSFRQKLIDAYGKCAITGCDVVEVLEAAHIYPYRGEETNHITNGILLRSDIHNLFDLGLISIDAKTYMV